MTTEKLLLVIKVNICNQVIIWRFAHKIFNFIKLTSVLVTVFVLTLTPTPLSNQPATNIFPTFTPSMLAELN